MGLLSSLFGGGSSTNVTQSSTTTAQVDVSTQITNVLNLDSLADALSKFGAMFADASATSTQTQATATMAAAILGATVQQDAENQRRALLEKWLKHITVALLVLGGGWLILRRK